MSIALLNGVLINEQRTKIQGIKHPDNTDTYLALNDSGPFNITTKTTILSGATAGTDSGWLPIAPYPERLGYALDSGSTSTTFTIDVSADGGATTLSQAFTGSYASSTVAEFSYPIQFSATTATHFKVTVTSGGPLTFVRGA